MKNSWKNSHVKEKKKTHPRYDEKSFFFHYKKSDAKDVADDVP